MSDNEAHRGELHNGMCFRDSSMYVKTDDFQHCRKDCAVHAEHDLNQTVIYACTCQQNWEFCGMSDRDLQNFPLCLLPLDAFAIVNLCSSEGSQMVPT